MLTYGFKQLEIDELTVSVAYGIQHFLGIAKAYIMYESFTNFFFFKFKFNEKKTFGLS